MYSQRKKKLEKISYFTFFKSENVLVNTFFKMFKCYINLIYFYQL